MVVFVPFNYTHSTWATSTHKRVGNEDILIVDCRRERVDAGACNIIHFGCLCLLCVYCTLQTQLPWLGRVISFNAVNAQNTFSPRAARRETSLFPSSLMLMTMASLSLCPSSPCLVLLLLFPHTTYLSWAGLIRLVAAEEVPFSSSLALAHSKEVDNVQLLGVFALHVKHACNGQKLRRSQSSNACDDDVSFRKSSNLTSPEKTDRQTHPFTYNVVALDDLNPTG